MISIKKGVEPDSLRYYRRTPGANFEGHLCAYCIQRITGKGAVKIEHYEKRTTENQLEYKNLLAVCSGNETLKSQNGRVVVIFFKAVSSDWLTAFC